MVLQAAPRKERAANQAALEQERLASQATLQAALDERHQTMARLIEEERARNEAGQRALYELFVVCFFHISQIMCVMSVSILTNTTHSSGSVREERSSPSADARLLFDWHGEFHYKLVLIIECHHAN